MAAITDWLGNSSGPVVYTVVAALVFCEDALFFGFVLPGETAVVLGGVIAARGGVSIVPLCAIVVAAAVAGDSVGYEVGRRVGPRLLRSGPLRRHGVRIDHAQDLVRRRGPAAVFIGRFVAFFRALTPALAGASHMRYRTFLLFNAAGGLVWGIGFALLGYYAGTAYEKVERTAGTAVAAAVAAVVVAGAVVWHIRRRRREPTPRDGSEQGDGPSQDGRRTDGPAADGPAQDRPDAEQPDAGRPDVDAPDAGPPDHGRPDHGRPDHGRPDDGGPDARRPDTEPPPDQSPPPESDGRS